jgi:hypothetical protein
LRFPPKNSTFAHPIQIFYSTTLVYFSARYLVVSSCLSQIQHAASSQDGSA